MDKRILVIGATGAQGGSVAHHLLSAGRYKVRALTRGTQTSKILALQGLGAEIAVGDLNDVGSLLAALKDCDAVFGVTNYWEHFDREYAQGKNLVDAIAQSQIQHAVLSTLANTKQLSGGRIVVPHFDSKAHIEEYARSRAIPATFIHVAFYFENFLSYFPPRRVNEDNYAFGFPQGSTPLAGVAASDIGGVVAKILDEAYWYRGKAVGVVGDELRGDEYAHVMTQVLGKKIAYQHMDKSAFAALGFPGAADIADMFDFYRHYVPHRTADLQQSHELYPAMQRFESWVRSHAPELKQVLH